MTEELSRMCLTLFSSSRTPLKERTSRDKKLSQECGLSAVPVARRTSSNRRRRKEHNAQRHAPIATQESGRRGERPPRKIKGAEMIEEPAGGMTPTSSSQAAPKSPARMKSKAQPKSEKITTSGADPRWSEGALRKAETARGSPGAIIEW